MFLLLQIWLQLEILQCSVCAFGAAELAAVRDTTELLLSLLLRIVAWQRAAKDTTTFSLVPFLLIGLICSHLIHSPVQCLSATDLPEIVSCFFFSSSDADLTAVRDIPM